MGMLTGYEALVPPWPPAPEVPAAWIEDVSIEELVEAWDVELEARRRRARLHAVRSDSPSHGQSSAA
jgi:hypothetical protein